MRLGVNIGLPALLARADPMSSPAASFSTPNITITATTSVDLTAGRFGASITVNGAAAVWYDGAGAASSQSLVLSLTDIGAVAGDLIGIDPGYSLTDPAVDKVYASESGLYITPSISTPTISDTTPTVGDTLTGTNGTALTRLAATRSVLWLADAVSTGDTDSSYSVVSGDVGKVLTYRNTTSDGGSATSAATSAVASAGSAVTDFGAMGRTSASSASPSYTVTGGSNAAAFAVVLLGPATTNTPGVPTVTFGGQAMTGIGLNITQATRKFRAEIFYLANPPTGSQTLAITGDAETGILYYNVYGLTGVDQATPIRATSVYSNNTDGDGSDLYTIPNTVSGDIVITCGENAGGSTSTDGTAYSANNTGAWSSLCDYSSAAGTSKDVTYTWAASNLVFGGVAVKPA